MIQVAVPLFGELGLYRQRAWEACQKHWAESGAQVVAGTGTSRAAARNAAAACLTGDVLCFADADTVVPVEQLQTAIDLARERDSFVIAYTVLHRLLRDQSIDFRRPQGYRTEDVSNGVVCVSRTLWEETGGFDERFNGWAGEDRAFLYACLTLQGQAEALRVPGNAIHLWHPPSREATRPDRQYRANIGLALRYKRAAGIERREGLLVRTPGAVRDRGVMEAMLREPGGPRSVASDCRRPST